MVMPPDDNRWMRLAFMLGSRGLGQVWPNPAVGCVIVKDGSVVGRGWTQPTGRPHAEIVALKQAENAARGATAYVTLEPCAHTGQSGPCSSALIDAGIRHVVSAFEDPDPRVAGQGYRALTDANIKVTQLTPPLDTKDTHLGFFMRIKQQRPMIALKLATSLDGKIATGTGESKWITGSEARRHVHLMRSQFDAILIGSGTAKTDDPQLDIRNLGLCNRNPVRIILDRRLEISPKSRLVATTDAQPLWIVHGPNAPDKRHKNLRNHHVVLIKVPEENGRLNLTILMEKLADRGLTRLYCEGGGTLAASLISLGLIDQLIQYQAGVVLGNEGISAIAPLFNFNKLSEFPRFQLQKTMQFGADNCQIWTRPLAP